MALAHSNSAFRIPNCFSEVKLPVPRRIALQHPELDVAQLLVEGERLVLEGVQVDAKAVVPARIVLNGGHDASADALTAELVRQPELRNVDPAPSDVAEQAADDSATPVPDEDGELNLVRVANDGAVELEKSLIDDTRIVAVWSLFEIDAETSHRAREGLKSGPAAALCGSRPNAKN